MYYFRLKSELFPLRPKTFTFYSYSEVAKVKDGLVTCETFSCKFALEKDNFEEISKDEYDKLLAGSSDSSIVELPSSKMEEGEGKREELKEEKVKEEVNKENVQESKLTRVKSGKKKRRRRESVSPKYRLVYKDSNKEDFF